MAKRAVAPSKLRAIRPNRGTEALYKRRLMGLIAEMQESVLFWVKAAYRANPPVMAQDDLPSTELKRAIRKLARRWQKRFDEAAPKLADYFTQAAGKRSTAQMMKILRDGGFTVDFTMTRSMRDAMNAAVTEQVGLIKSIPQKYFTDLEGMVMRNVQKGTNLQEMVAEIGPKVDLKRIRMGRKPGETDKSLYARTQRRAVFIARDQSNKASAVITRVRQTEAGITEAVWVHSGGGREPRPTHVAASKRGQRYDIRKGWWDPAVEKFILPGELPNCRCVSRPVIPGL